MKTEEIVAAIDSVDRRLNNNKRVPEDERVIDLTAAYSRHGWGGAKPTPLPDTAQKALRLEDKTGDARWAKHFRSSRRDLAIYRSHIGFYWCLRWDEAVGTHVLMHVGSAADVVKGFGE